MEHRRAANETRIAIEAGMRGCDGCDGFLDHLHNDRMSIGYRDGSTAVPSTPCGFADDYIDRLQEAVHIVECIIGVKAWQECITAYK
jgi:hypothetical protein